MSLLEVKIQSAGYEQKKLLEKLILLLKKENWLV